MVAGLLPKIAFIKSKTNQPQIISTMENLSGPIIVQENETHFLVGIHYNDRHLAREINGRAWDGEKRRWVWRRDRKNYEHLKEAFKEIAKQFEISDKNLIGEKNREDKEVTHGNDIQTEDDWGVHPDTDNWLQIKQLQSIEDKIDALLKLGTNSNDKGKDSNESANTEEETNLGSRYETPIAMSTKIQEVIAALTNDKIFNELILREEANQSPIQRVHNKIRDEIRRFKDVEDEDIHQALEERFKRQKKSYIRRGISLLPLIWFAQEQKYYRSGEDGQPDIYQMLYLFNSTRVAVEKYDQANEEMSRIYAILCLSLGRIIWSKIRLPSAEEEKVSTEMQSLESN